MCHAVAISIAELNMLYSYIVTKNFPNQQSELLQAIENLKHYIIFSFIIPFYLQYVPIKSANCVNSYAVACRRVLISATLYLIDSRPRVASGNEWN
jgi:hypothetical protein